MGSPSLQSEAPAVAAETYPQDLQDPLQGPGRPGAAGRLLPEPGGLVIPQRAQRGAGDLRVPVERLHQPGGAAEGAGGGGASRPPGSRAATAGPLPTVGHSLRTAVRVASLVGVLTPTSVVNLRACRA